MKEDSEKEETKEYKKRQKRFKGLVTVVYEA